MSSDKDTVKTELDNKLKAAEPTTTAPTPVANAPAPDTEAKKPEQLPPSHKIADILDRSEDAKKQKTENPLMDAINELKDWVIEMHKTAGDKAVINKITSVLSKLTDSASTKEAAAQPKTETPAKIAPEPDDNIELSPMDDTTDLSSDEEAKEKKAENPLQDAMNELGAWVREMQEANAAQEIITKATSVLTKLTNVAAEKEVNLNNPDQPKAVPAPETELSAMDDTTDLNADRNLEDIEIQERKKPAPEVPNDPELEVKPR